MKSKPFLSTLFIIALLVLIPYLLWANKTPELTTYTVHSSTLPDAFSGFRIAHVSDLHNTELGKNNKKLLKLLKRSRPDMIAITGDLIDFRHTDINAALKFVRAASKVAPCYYVTGNHESRTSQYSYLKEKLEKIGVTVLENDRLILEHNGETITLLGIHDPTFDSDYVHIGSSYVLKKNLSNLMPTDDSFVLLLTHRPEHFELYAKLGIDLSLAGHAHGGQIRIPFIGGLFAPHQGFFPQYDSGMHTIGNSALIVSRGLGNSSFPLRINNRPELVLVELKSASQ